MNNLTEVREWIRLEEGDDITLSSLINTSKVIIKKSTGVSEADAEKSIEGIEAYRTLQKIIVTRLYENREGADVEKGLIALYTSLKYIIDESGG